MKTNLIISIKNIGEILKYWNMQNSYSLSVSPFVRPHKISGSRVGSKDHGKLLFSSYSWSWSTNVAKILVVRKASQHIEKANQLIGIDWRDLF